MPRSATLGRAWPRLPTGPDDGLRGVVNDLAGSDQWRESLALSACRDVAAKLLVDLAQQASAPGRREAQAQLRRLRERSLDLAAEVAALHPVLVRLVSAHGGGEVAARGMASDLRALGLAIEGALLALPGQSMARPGPGSIADVLRGDPRLRLCCAAARIIIAFRGRDACASTPGGLLYRLASAIWCFATGEDAEAFGLERYVLAAVRAERPRAPIACDGAAGPADTPRGARQDVA